jgi:methionyl-tRNA synthetase
MRAPLTLLKDPTQLVNPRCKIDGATPVLRDTKHVFLLLDKLQKSVEEWSRKSEEEGKWSSNGIHITESWLAKGLNPRGITRGETKLNLIQKRFLICGRSQMGYSCSSSRL